MNISRPATQKRFALLFAVLLLLCNALITAHAFGDVEHAVKDGCQICHQFERHAVPPVDDATPRIRTRHHVLHDTALLACHPASVPAGFQPRAPPSA